MASPRLAVMLLTYKRTDCALRTVEALLDGWEGEPPHFHIADDGSAPGHVEAIQDAIQSRHGAVRALTISDSRRRGYGANYNAGTGVVHFDNDLVLPLEDDWELQRPFNVEYWTSPFLVPAEVASVQCVRLGYLGWTGQFIGRSLEAGRVKGWLLDPDSPEHHVFSGHPRLETVAFERRLGLWPEGLAAGATEFDVCYRRESREGVLWPMELDGRPLFAHIGTESLNDAPVGQTSAAR